MPDSRQQQQTALQSVIAQSKAIDAIVVERGAMWSVPDLVKVHFAGSKVFLVADYLPSFDEMRRMLAIAGTATSPAEIGVDRAYHRETLLAARLIRRRDTILDFLEETGRLDAAVEHVFSHSGRWG